MTDKPREELRNDGCPPEDLPVKPLGNPGVPDRMNLRGDKCTPAGDPVDDVFYEPGGTLEPTPTPRGTPDLLPVENPVVTLECGGDLPPLGGPVTVPAGAIVEFFDWRTIPELTEDRLRYLSELYEGELEDILVWATQDFEDVQASIRSTYKLTRAQALFAWETVRDLQVRVLDLATVTAEGALECWWENEETPVTCENTADTYTVEPGEFRSANSQEDANTLARLYGESRIVCVFENPEVTVTCVGALGFPEAVPGNESAPSAFGQVGSYTVSAGEFTASGGFTSDLTANLEEQARVFAISQLQCFYVNEEVSTSCANLHPGEPATAENTPANAAEGRQGQSITIPQGFLQSQLGVTDATNQAQALAESLMDCFWGNDALTLDCPQGGSQVPGGVYTASVPANAFTSYVGKADADAQAQFLAESRLVCLYTNSPVVARCNEPAEDDTVLLCDPENVVEGRPSDEFERQQGTSVVVVYERENATAGECDDGELVKPGTLVRERVSQFWFSETLDDDTFTPAGVGAEVGAVSGGFELIQVYEQEEEDVYCECVEPEVNPTAWTSTIEVYSGEHEGTGLTAAPGVQGSGLNPVFIPPGTFVEEIEWDADAEEVLGELNDKSWALSLSMLDCQYGNDSQVSECFVDEEDPDFPAYAEGASVFGQAPANMFLARTKAGANTSAKLFSESQLDCLWDNGPAAAGCTPDPCEEVEMVPGDPDYLDETKYEDLLPFYDVITGFQAVFSAERDEIPLLDEEDNPVLDEDDNPVLVDKWTYRVDEEDIFDESGAYVLDNARYGFPEGATIVAVTPPGLFTSYTSKEEATANAKLFAASLLDCFWENEEVIEGCEGVDVSGVSVDPGEEGDDPLCIESITLTDIPEPGTEENPYARDATVAAIAPAGMFRSQDSRNKAQVLAQLFAESQLDCWWENDITPAVCDGVDLESILTRDLDGNITEVNLENAAYEDYEDPYASGATIAAYAPAGMFTSYTSKQETEDLAELFAESQLDCWWENDAIGLTCSDDPCLEEGTPSLQDAAGEVTFNEGTGEWEFPIDSVPHTDVDNETYGFPVSAVIAALVVPGLFTSYTSKSEAQNTAQLFAESQLDCWWENDEVIEYCGGDGGGYTGGAIEPSLDGCSFEKVPPTWGGPEGEEYAGDRIMGATLKGSFTSRSSKAEAQNTAQLFAESQLDCFWANDELEATCNDEFGEPPEGLHPTSTQGVITIPPGLFTSTSSKTEAVTLAETYRTSILYCVFGNQEIEESDRVCLDEDEEPEAPIQNPGVPENTVIADSLEAANTLAETLADALILCPSDIVNNFNFASIIKKKWVISSRVINIVIPTDAGVMRTITVDLATHIDLEAPGLTRSREKVTVELNSIEASDGPWKYAMVDGAVGAQPSNVTVVTVDPGDPARDPEMEVTYDDGAGTLTLEFEVTVEESVVVDNDSLEGDLGVRTITWGVPGGEALPGGDRGDILWNDGDGWVVRLKPSQTGTEEHVLGFNHTGDEPVWVEAEEITVITGVQVDPVTQRIEVKTRTVRVVDPSAESDWTLIHQGGECDE